MIPYAELHCRTVFSFLDGASSAEELIASADSLGLTSLAITDVDGLYGIVEARSSLLERFGLTRAQEGQSRLKLIYGSELSFGDDRVVVLVQEPSGYGNLCEAISIGRMAALKGEFKLAEDRLLALSGGLIALAGGPRSAAMREVTQGNVAAARARLSRLKEAFGDRLYIELVRHLSVGDKEKSLAMAEVAKSLSIPVVATNDVHFHVPDRKRIYDLMCCIRGGYSLAESGRRLLPNAEAHLKSPIQLAALFNDLPEAVEEASAIAERIDFRLCQIKSSYPPPDLPPGQSADERLAELAREGLDRRLGSLAKRYAAQLERELQLIAQLKYAGYFLTMWDVVQVCRAKKILCQGRGSAANSLVCFALGITSVRPDVIQMLFERFVSPERDEPPDIDLDIEHERREEIIQYVYGKYRRDHSGMVSEVIRYRSRSALRDVGKALGFSEVQLDRLSKQLGYRGALDDRALTAAGVPPDSPAVRQWLELSAQFEGIPRHLSIHVGGFILSEERLDRTVPIENGRMKDRTVIQWNKDDVDEMGMFKLDLLGLGMLTVLAKAFQAVKETGGPTLTLENVPEDDPPTYQMLRAADSVGVFQVESRAQMNMLPRLEPKVFYDLVVQVAIVRPGPIQGQMVHPYLRRRAGQEPVEYPHPKLKDILERTHGVPLFQEQVMRLAVAVGGYTPGQADQLRRDMASWKASGKMKRHRERLLSGMRKNGLSDGFANQVLKQIEGFGAYGFPESHAAAFAHLAYVSAYLKCHHPVEFACALLNSQPMGFYSTEAIVTDLKRRHPIRPIDVQRSEWDCTVEERTLRLGLRMVQSLGERVGRGIAWARKQRPFSSVSDLQQRAALPSRTLLPLAASGALQSLYSRREALWQASAAAAPLGPLLRGVEREGPSPDLPILAPLEEAAFDVQYGGAFPRRHPMEILRDRLTQAKILRATDLDRARSGEQVTVAGLVITRQRPGEGKVVFVTLEDETGHVDVAVLEATFAQFRQEILASSALIVTGKLQKQGAAKSVTARKIRPLTEAGLAVPSHDFH